MPSEAVFSECKGMNVRDFGESVEVWLKIRSPPEKNPVRKRRN